MTKTAQNNTAIGGDSQYNYDFSKSPFKKINYGIKMGIAYELRGFQLGANYSLMLSNMANNEFWEDTRIPVFNNQTGDNLMSGYKQRIHSIEIKLGYIIRY